MGLLDGYTVERTLALCPATLYHITEGEPIINAGMHLSALDVEGIVSEDKKGTANGIVLGYSVLRMVNRKNVWATLYKTKISEAKMQPLLARPGDDLTLVIDRLRKKGWGYAVIVDPKKKPTNLLGLLDLAIFYVRSGVSHNLSALVNDNATAPLKTVSEDYSVFNAIKMMLEQHVRRLYLERLKLIVSDRGIIKWLLSEKLESLRDKPKEVLDAPLSKMSGHLHRPEFVDGRTTGAEALDLIISNEAHCVVTKDTRRILTPWDITTRLLYRQSR